MSRAVSTHRGAALRAPTSVEVGLLVAVELCVAVGALFGGRALLSDAAGFGVKEEWLRYGLFHDYTIPGAILTVAVGGTMLAAAVLALVRSSAAFPAALIAGLTLLGFLFVETAILGYRGPQQLVLLTVCGAAGLTLVVLGHRARSAVRQGERI